MVYSTKAMLENKILLLFSFCVILFLIIFGILDIIKVRNLKSKGIRTTGIVEEIQLRGTGEFRTIFSFKDRGGNKHMITSKLSSSYLPFKKKDAVDIIYNGQNPKEARIDSFLEMYYGHIFFLVGFFFSLIEILFVIKIFSPIFS